MDNLGSEIGNKMRSAVKAKLIELGSGTSSGYIDDELPDYVMIMVANKRSKEQMIEDLKLFLGKSTDVFVNWLHQVLEKLQEVTLPTTALQKNKKKSTDVSDKKDKKGKKKLRRGEKEANKETDRSTTPPIQLPPVASITDVFADVVMQKARKSLGNTTVTVKTKAEGTKAADGTNEFDIPTISEIAKDAVNKSNQRKEFTELEELQKKINEAKRQLRQITDESEDEDFINIRDDNNDIDTDFRKISSKDKALIDKNPSNKDSAKDFLQQTEKEINDRRSVRERLGMKSQQENIVSLSTHRRIEQAIYVPAFRRNAQENIEQKESRAGDNERKRTQRRSVDRERERERDREHVSERSREYKPKNIRDLREKVKISDRLGLKNNRDPDRIEKVNIAQKRGLVSKRIGSRVIVAPKRLKPETENEIIVSSVVNVKPRPIIPTNKQASKNLLLRAVAEAQKSTALVQPKPDSVLGAKRPAKELYTKSFKSKRHLPKSNIIVEVETGGIHNDAVVILDEYVSSSEQMDDDQFEYVPKPIDSLELTSIDNNHPQFVVTLDPKFRKRKRVFEVQEDNLSDGAKRQRTQSPSQAKTDRKVNQLIIKNDTDDEEELRREVENSSLLLKRKRSPIKFDVNKDNPLKKRSMSQERQSIEKNNDRSSNEYDKEDKKIRTSKDGSSKYDNLPSLSSAIAIATNDTKPSKKERCKFFPSCGKGDRCEYIHPSTPCKTFPNCKFGDSCLYLHPKCKFDLTCSKLGCNYSHTQVTSVAPPLSSHVVPVTNYKKIVTTPLPALCKFYPKCSNTLCEFYHPKPCKFGKNCTNKVECNFYHFDLPSTVPMSSRNKMKWVASSA